MTTGRINQIAVERIERVESNALRPVLANQTGQREGKLRPVHVSLKRFFPRRAESPLPDFQQAPSTEPIFWVRAFDPLPGKTTAKPVFNHPETRVSLHTS